MTEYQWKTVSVVGFDELMQALDRADRKGYMPDAIKDEWEAFNWKPAQPEQEPVEYWTVANGWVSEQAEVPAAVWVEPDFWEHCNRVNCGTAYRLPAPGRQPLYASPPAQRKPLKLWTEAQHERAYRNSPELHKDVKSLAAFKRVAKEIAAMYGIKENT